MKDLKVAEQMLEMKQAVVVSTVAAMKRALPELWAITIKQIEVDAKAFLWGVVLAVIPSGVGLFVGLLYYEKDGDAWCVLAFISGFILFLSGLIGIVEGAIAIKKLKNPEYYAAQRFFKDAGGDRP